MWHHMGTACPSGVLPDKECLLLLSAMPYFIYFACPYLNFLGMVHIALSVL